MKISIITATYNSAKTIQGAIDSVRSQDYQNIEHIIVDGLSSDGTTEILEQNKDSIANWVSEKDLGIYDALNKGIDMATGDVVGILHSDDEFASDSAISQVAKNFTSEKDIDACYGDLVYVDQNEMGKVIRNWKSKAYSSELFYRGWMPAHPTFFLKREFYNRYGKYDLSFYTAADYELMLRMFLKHNVKAEYIPQVLVKMRVGGQSNVSWKNRWIANQEDARSWKVNGLQAKWYTRWAKPLSKLTQFLK